MDKNDVEMEDVQKQTQDLGNSGTHELKDNIPGEKIDSKGEEEVPLPAAITDVESGATDTADDTCAKSKAVEHENAQGVAENQNHAKSDAEGLKNNAEAEREMQKNAAETKAETEKTTDEQRMNNSEITTTEHLNFAKVEAEQQNNDAKTVAQEQDNAKNEAEELNSDKMEVDHRESVGSGEKEQTANLNSNQDGNPDNNLVKVQTLAENAKDVKSLVESAVEGNPQSERAGTLTVVNQRENEGMTAEHNENVNEGKVSEQREAETKTLPLTTVTNAIVKSDEMLLSESETQDASLSNKQDLATPGHILKCSTAKAGEHSGDPYRDAFNAAKMGESDDGTPEEQAAFMKELEIFYRERSMEFKPPKFYGQLLNLLKLWRSVIKLGGYDRVTGSKLWRQVGESFHPPKTCTTVSWTFRIFYEKALLEYERHKKDSGELQFPVSALPESSALDNEGNGYQASGSGRHRRDAAARAMQGWHVQRLFGYGEVGEPIVKDKNLNNLPKREKNLKSIGSLKQKRPNEVEHPVKSARTETSKQLITTVVDVGPPADWVKINVRETKDCFEVYALVPGLLREEVRVQSDPAGRLVITGQPEQLDNPWGITPFKKVVSLPARIDPLQTSAVVSLHGRLFVRVPFEQA